MISVIIMIVTISAMGLGSANIANRLRIFSIPYGLFLIYQYCYYKGYSFPFRIEFVESFFEISESSLLTGFINFLGIWHFSWARFRKLGYDWKRWSHMYVGVVVYGFIGTILFPLKNPKINMLLLEVSILGYFLGLFAPRKKPFSVD